VITIDRRRRRRPSRRRYVWWALALLVVFAVGIALGEALNDNPQPGRTVTQDRTFTLPPESSTVTVTTP
jgi:hypothetical protein